MIRENDVSLAPTRLITFSEMEKSLWWSVLGDIGL